MLQKIALILVGIGVLILIGWSVNAFFMSAEIPLLIRISSGAIGVGILILIGIVIKDRMSRAKTEDFKEVER
ncbi:hypothetical protein ACFLXD_01760 [Chloroflexota bacterium]